MIKTKENQKGATLLLSTFFFGDLFPTFGFLLLHHQLLPDTHRSACAQQFTVTCPVWKI
jgi:hypothetical protein